MKKTELIRKNLVSIKRFNQDNPYFFSSNDPGTKINNDHKIIQMFFIKMFLKNSKIGNSKNPQQKSIAVNIKEAT